MAYCTADDVIGEFRSLEVSASGTVITTASLADFIDQASNEIDGRLGVKFVTPITGTGALTILKTICIWLVADRIKEILRVKTASPDVGQNVRDGGTAKEARKMLVDIVEGRLQLPGATLASAGGGVKSFNASTNQKHQFKRNSDQW